MPENDYKYEPDDFFSSSYRYVRDKAKSAVTSLYDPEHPYNAVQKSMAPMSPRPSVGGYTPPSGLAGRELKSPGSGYAGYYNDHPLSGLETPPERRAAAPTAGITPRRPAVAAPTPETAPAPVPAPVPQSQTNEAALPKPGMWKSFTDWFGALGPDKQSALQMAGLKAGLSILAQPPSAYPISAAETIGKAGLQGLQTYSDEMETSRKGALERRKLDLEENKTLAEIDKIRRPELPYKVGQRVKYTGEDGFEYEGTFQGLSGVGNKPVFTESRKVAQSEDSPRKRMGEFRQYVQDLTGLYKTKASIQKGYDPFTGQMIPQENISNALATIEREIQDSERFIKQYYPNEWSVRRGLDTSARVSPEEALKSPGYRPGATGGTGAVKVGEIQKGYRFKGGDPSKKENWEKVQ